MRIVFRPEARTEALAAQAWYEECSPGLGLEFARALDAAIAAAIRTPLAFPAITIVCRQTLLRKFPYSLVYRAETDEFLVVAVFHHRRDSTVKARRATAFSRR